MLELLGSKIPLRKGQAPCAGAELLVARRAELCWGCSVLSECPTPADLT